MPKLPGFLQKKLHGANKTPDAAAGISQPANDQVNGGESGEIKEYYLKKHRPGCSGMFWRSDPTGAMKRPTNDNWPRDGASFRGVAVEAKGRRWLHATEVKQDGGNEWINAPAGAFMPFIYEDHYSIEKA